MAKTNYSYEKRGREIEKQKKQEEKRLKKQAAKEGISIEEARAAAKKDSSSEA